MKTNWSSPNTSSPPLRFGWTMQSAAPPSIATSGQDVFNLQTPFQTQTSPPSKPLATQSPFALQPSFPVANEPIHPQNLFYNPGSVEAQARLFISDALAATSPDKTATQNGQPVVQRSLSMAVPFSSNRWNAGTSMLVVQLSPDVSMPMASSGLFQKGGAAQAESLKSSGEPKPVFAAQVVGVAANQVSPSKAVRQDASNIAYNAPAETPPPALSAFERKLLNQPASVSFGAQPATGDRFVSGTTAQKASSERLNTVLQFSDYSNNPFEVLSRIDAAEPKIAPEPKTEASAPPVYTLQAYQRVLRGTNNVPPEIMFMAETDHRLTGNPNSVVTYAYLPQSGTVLTEPMMASAGIYAKDAWYAPAVRFGAQVFRPLVQAAPWLNAGNLSVQDNNLWFGSRWNMPLVRHQTSDEQEAQVYQLTRLSNGQMAQVVGNFMLSELPFGSAPGTGQPQALDGAPQPSQAQTLAANLKMNASVKETNALTTQKLQSTDTANTYAHASVPVTLSATQMSQEQPLFKGRAAYRQWVHDQVADMEQRGLALAT